MRQECATDASHLAQKCARCASLLRHRARPIRLTNRSPPSDQEIGQDRMPTRPAQRSAPSNRRTANPLISADPSGSFGPRATKPLPRPPPVLKGPRTRTPWRARGLYSCYSDLPTPTHGAMRDQSESPASFAQVCQSISSLERTSSLLVNAWFSVKTTRFSQLQRAHGTMRPSQPRKATAAPIS